VLLPFVGRQRIRFDPQWLLIGEIRHDYRVPWDDIVWVGILEHEHNLLVTLRLRTPEAIEVSPPSRRRAFLRSVTTTRA